MQSESQDAGVPADTGTQVCTCEFWSNVLAGHLQGIPGLDLLLLPGACVSVCGCCGARGWGRKSAGGLKGGGRNLGASLSIQSWPPGVSLLRAAGMLGHPDHLCFPGSEPELWLLSLLPPPAFLLPACPDSGSGSAIQARVLIESKLWEARTEEDQRCECVLTTSGCRAWCCPGALVALVECPCLQRASRVFFSCSFSFSFLKLKFS